MCNPIQITAAPWSDPMAQAALRAIRMEVFVREQQVPEELEWDGLDETAFHLLARDTFGNPVATARMLPDGHIGRVAVMRPWRGKGVGTEIMRVMIHEAGRRRLHEVDLDAQVKAIEFYERLGFAAEGPEFMDAGIPHRHMRLSL
jgi:predicted GNAT family N-acyltransferase